MLQGLTLLYSLEKVDEAGRGEEERRVEAEMKGERG